MHINRDKTERYIRGLVLHDFSELPTTELNEIEMHLDACDTCADVFHEEYRALQTLLRWNIRFDNALVIRDRIRRGIEAALVVCPDARRKQRLQRWLSALPAIPKALLKVCLLVPKTGRRLISQITLADADAAPAFAGAFRYEMIPETARGSPQSKLLPNLTKVMIQDSTELKTISLQEATGELTVEIEDYGQEEPEYCLLVPIEGQSKASVQTEGYSRTGGRFRYTFKGLPPGEYLLLFEPDAIPSPTSEVES